MSSRDLKNVAAPVAAPASNPAASVSMKDEFKFNLGARVKTPAGDRGVIEHLGRAQGRRMYAVRTESGSHWFEESELLSDEADRSPRG